MFFEKLQLYFGESILRLGNTDINFEYVLYFVISIFILFQVTGKLTTLLVSRILSRYIAQTGMRPSIGSIFKYTLLTIGIIVIVQSAGVDIMHQAYQPVLSVLVQSQAYKISLLTLLVVLSFFLKGTSILATVLQQATLPGYLTFILRIRTIEYIDRPKVLKCQLYQAIFEKFIQQGV